jgi:hypothetical protein
MNNHQSSMFRPCFDFELALFEIRCQFPKCNELYIRTAGCFFKELFNRAKLCKSFVWFSRTIGTSVQPALSRALANGVEHLLEKWIIKLREI